MNKPKITFIIILITVGNIFSMNEDDLFHGFFERYEATQRESFENPSLSEQISIDQLKEKLTWVHSFEIRELHNNDNRVGYQVNSHPISVASVIKLPVVNIALKAIQAGAMSESERLRVVSDNIQSYDGEPVGQTYTVRAAIEQTLYRSSNTCPNLLAKRLGGLNSLKNKLTESGYLRTGYNYLSSKRRTEKPEFKIGSTASDLAQSVYDFYHHYRHVQNPNSTGSAWYAFTHTKYKIPVSGADNVGGKIGTNSLSSTYAGIYEINGKSYIIVTLIDKKSFARKYKGPINANSGDKALMEANQVLVNALRSQTESL